MHPAQLEITVVENCPSKTSAVNLGLKEQELLYIDLRHQLFDALAVDGQVNGKRHSEINSSAGASLGRRTRAQLFSPTGVTVMLLPLGQTIQYITSSSLFSVGFVKGILCIVDGGKDLITE